MLCTRELVEKKKSSSGLFTCLFTCLSSSCLNRGFPTCDLHPPPKKSGSFGWVARGGWEGVRLHASVATWSRRASKVQFWWGGGVTLEQNIPGISQLILTGIWLFSVAILCNYYSEMSIVNLVGMKVLQIKTDIDFSKEEKKANLQSQPTEI